MGKKGGKVSGEWLTLELLSSKKGIGEGTSITQLEAFSNA